ncbi:MAG TPA: MMPL family transporter [Gaiellaceae bacterium]|nr:MMPL family transporter [Gaiellaceae bacterium]
MLDRLARVVIAHRRLVVGTWLFLIVFGVFSTTRVSSRWLEQFSIPGYSAYEANQRVLKTFGSGAQAPDVAVFHSSRDVTKMAGVERALARFEQRHPAVRVSSYWSTGSQAYVSHDRHTTFAEFYPPAQNGFSAADDLGTVRAAMRAWAPPGVTVHVTGENALYDSEGSGASGGPSVLTETLIGGLGALVILLFVFGTLPAVGMPLAVAAASILTTFSVIWALTYATSVSVIVQFLVALVGLGVAIDYSLLMIFRFREELGRGEDVETAVVRTMRHAGRSVVVSGSTVAIGLLSMVIIPIPVIRSIGIGGMLIPAVSVLAAITLLPALLVMLGRRINRLRVMPRKFVAGTDGESGPWGRWARLVMRRPVLIGAAGAALLVLLLVPGTRLNPADPQAASLVGRPADDGVIGFRQLTAAGISPGVLEPLVIVAENGPTKGDLHRIVTRLDTTPGIAGASSPPSWRRQGVTLVEAFPSVDASSKHTQTTISDLQNHVLPSLQSQLGGVRLTVGGVAPESRDFVHAVYGNFPLVLGFVVLLTFVLLMRAFRSVFLPFKAVVLNLASLGAAFGIIVFVFQQGHGAQAIWGVHATDVIISWIPLMIFAFLYGLSMDYEVFMLTRMREAYDETGDTERAVELGLARTGKLVTSAALVLMFAFFVLSTGPGVDIKQFGIGLAAGVIFDATVIRALLVPAIMRLAGSWNWWLPERLGRALLVRGRPAPDASR